jgi:hypothetical protein
MMDVETKINNKVPIMVIVEKGLVELIMISMKSSRLLLG